MEQLLNQIIVEAIKANASDIHFIPEREVQIKLRIRGNIQHYNQLKLVSYEKLLVYMKFSSHLDVSEKKSAQSGMMDFMYEENLYHIRVSTLPLSIGSEGCVLRILKAHFHETQIQQVSLYDYMKLSHGLLLLTGPTGSGKSTLLYSLLNFAKTKLNKQIITIEDPVEQRLDGVYQVNVNPKAGIDYGSAFKAILRCDPDIIMIGEIRDKNVAKEVIQASLSGHLVLSTMHANDTFGAVERLIEMDITKSELTQAIKLITSQRLINTRNERRLIIEELTKSQIEKLINNECVQVHTLNDQLKEIYEANLIDISELEKFNVATKLT